MFLRGDFIKLKSCFCLLALLLSSAIADTSSDWQSKKVNLRAGAGRTVKEVRYPAEKPVPISKDKKSAKHKEIKTIPLAPAKADRLMTETETSAEASVVIASMIESPPLDGFVPWVVIAVTDERGAELDFVADIHNQVVGDYAADNPESDYAIGIFDTGASAHVMGYENAVTTGLYTSGGIPKTQYLTSNTIPIAGVTGTVNALVSQPLGLFVDGLGAVEPNGLLQNRTNMVGQSNVSIAVGDEPLGIPDLVTAVGSPLSVYFDTSMRNDSQITLITDTNQYTSPDLRLYDQNDTNCPSYANSIPLELRPLGGVNVQWILDIEDLDFKPASPSIIVGNLSQSVFFVHSVDLYDGIRSAIDKDRFIFDTGAQVSVIGSRIAARLKLDPNAAEFEVVIQGVTGDTITVPGFYIDTIEIPALGQWLTLTNVPVILLDIASPEGGTVDGIIGMNLFTDFNLVLRGGGLFLQDDPALEFEPIDFAAMVDIAPTDGDGAVNYLDLEELANHWLTTPQSINWDPKNDIAPHPVRDGIINFLDIAMLAQYWLQSI